MRRTLTAILATAAVVVLPTVMARSQTMPDNNAGGSKVGGGTPTIPQPTATLTDKQKAALDKIEEFYKKVGDDKALVALRNARAMKAIQFTDSKSSEENASYYGGMISLPTSFVDRVRDVSDPNPRKMEIDRRVQLGAIVATAQSLVHEINHAEHDRGEAHAAFVNVDKTISALHPYGSHFESIAYDDALKRTEQWMQNIQGKLATEKGCTRENATMLSLLPEAWRTYNNYIFGKVGKSLLWKPNGEGTSYWLDSQGRPIVMHEKIKQISKVGEDAAKVQAACEMLESLAAVFGVPVPKDASFEQLMELLSKYVHDEKTLKELAEKMAAVAAAAGQGTITGKLNADSTQNVPGIMSAGYPLLLEKWKARRKALETQFDTAIRELSGTPLRLTYTPNPATFDSKAGKGEVTLSIMDDPLDKAMMSLNDSVRRLTGLTPKVSVIDYWTMPGEKDKPFKYPDGVVRKINFPDQKNQDVSVRRVVTVGASASSGSSLPSNSPLRQKITRTAAETVRFKAVFPTEIAGKWTGTLTISTLNYQKENEEGCAALENLKGKPMNASFVLSPKDLASGRMELTVSPAQGSKAKPGEAAVLSYRNANGAFSATGAQGQGNMQLKGGFQQQGTVWRLGGTWTWSGKGASAAGVWSSSNPNAR